MGISADEIDKIFEPLMNHDGILANTVGKIIGTGSGRGIALMFTILGFVTMIATCLAYQYLPLRKVEHEIPDANI